MIEMEHFINELEKQYDSFKEKSLINRRFKHKDILPLIEKLGKQPLFEVSELGKSIEGREIFLIKAGTGKLKVLLWSQMHGNEPTATAALFDIFNFLTSEAHFAKEKTLIFEEITLYFVPMVNPDGAQVFKRRNALDIDLNRDAARLEATETKILKKLRDDIKPDFGFNLHDQDCYYTAGATSKPATISFLTPSFNTEKDIDHGRRASMEQIVMMNQVLQKYIPGQIGRYSDDFMPTAFGDSMQKWGTSIILIESGGYKNDPEKQVVRKMNFLAILASLYGLSIGNPDEMYYMDYFKIPENKKEKLFDLLIRNATIKKNGQNFIIDLGIRRKEIENPDYSGFTYQSEIFDIGDLGNYFGYDEIDASGLIIQSADSNLLMGFKADFKLVDAADKLRYKIVNGFMEEEMEIVWKLDSL